MKDGILSTIFGESVAAALASREFDAYRGKVTTNDEDASSLLDLRVADALQMHKGTVTFELGDVDTFSVMPLEGFSLTEAMARNTGASIRLDDFDEFNEAAGAFASRLWEEFGLPPRGDKGHLGCKLFIGSSGAGLAPHYHRLAAVAIQLRGSKTFSLAPATYPSPSWQPGAFDRAYAVQKLPGQVLAEWADITNPNEIPPLEEHVLGAGDAVFIPPGYWHATRANQDSLSISFFVDFPRYGEVLGSYLESLRSSSELLRTPLPPLSELLSEASLGTASEALAEIAEIAQRIVPAHALNLALPKEERKVFDDQLLRRHPDATINLTEHAVYLSGTREARGQLEDEALAVVRAVAETSSAFLPADLDLGQDSRDLLHDVLAWLLQLGVVERVPTARARCTIS